MINVELPVVEVAESSTDFIFLLEDDTYLHFEFQTAYNKNDLIRFLIYDARLYERDKRKVTTIIIYSSDVRTTADNLDIGSLVYSPSKVMMYDYDGNAIYAELESKLRSGQDLTDTDMLNLIFLPLMRNDIPKRELAKRSVELSQIIPDKNKRDVCIASAVTFMSRYLNDSEINNILEVFRMTDIMTRLLKDKAIEIAKKAITKGISIEDIADLTDLDIATIKALKEESDKKKEAGK